MYLTRENRKKEMSERSEREGRGEERGGGKRRRKGEGEEREGGGMGREGEREEDNNILASLSILTNHGPLALMLLSPAFHFPNRTS